MKLKLYHAAAAAAMALSVMLLTACGSPKQADPLPIIRKVWIYGGDLPSGHHQL